MSFSEKKMQVKFSNTLFFQFYNEIPAVVKHKRDGVDEGQLCEGIFRHFCIKSSIMKTNTKLTAVFEEAEGGYVAYVKEINGINTQGNTMEEAKDNLKDATSMNKNL